MNDVGDVPPSSSFALLWSGICAPGRWWAWSGLDPPKVPLVPKLRWSAGVRGGDSGHGRAIVYHYNRSKFIAARLMPIQCCICTNSRLIDWLLNSCVHCDTVCLQIVDLQWPSCHLMVRRTKLVISWPVLLLVTTRHTCGVALMVETHSPPLQV